MGGAKSKLNGLYFGIAMFVALIVGGCFNSFTVALIVLAFIVGVMQCNGDIRPEQSGCRRRRS